MKVAPRTQWFVWISALCLALGFLMWTTLGRIQRVEYVSALPGRADVPDHVTPASPTGYANGQRELIVPERNEVSFAWIAQTQQMFAQHTWRVRRVDSDNAPNGRPVYSTSPYRWWLGTLAWLDHVFSGQPTGFAVERAALFADPVLQGLFLLGAAVFVAWRFGFAAAGLFSLGLGTLFPFAAGFLPGTPDPHTLARVGALASTLVLLAGVRAGQRTRRWFVWAGVLGGLGLWVDAATLVPILAGLSVGAWVGLAAEKGRASGETLPGLSPDAWRSWGLSGSATIGLAYLAEYFPAYLGSWRLQVIHPLYGLAWLGAGELLYRTARGIVPRGRDPANTGTFVGSVWDGVVIVGSLAAIASLPVAIKLSGSDALFLRDASSFRLTSQPGGIAATNTFAWLTRDGMSAAVVATFLPVLALVPVGWIFVRRATSANTRLSLALVVVPTLVALAFASVQLAWWGLAGGMLLVSLVAGLPEKRASYSLFTYITAFAFLVAFVVVPGALQLRPGRKADALSTLTTAEAQELIERHLAHWLGKHTEEPGAVIYAPPHPTVSLAFFGGLRGIGTFAPENRAGFGVSLMIAAANTIEEAQALLQSRDVRYVVLPSWDPFFDNFAELYLDKRFSGRTSLFAGNLKRFKLPAWLRPVPYQMPEVSGYENQSVLVFEVVDDQSPAVAASRLLEYFIESGKLDQAAGANEDLRRFPGDVGALAARAQAANVREDSASLAQTVELIVERLANGGDRYLPWDRRVSLAIVLAQANKIDLAQTQVRRCMTDVTTARLRSLSTGSLYKLLVLSQTFNVSFPDSNVKNLAIDLLPVELRNRL